MLMERGADESEVRRYIEERDAKAAAAGLDAPQSGLGAVIAAAGVLEDGGDEQPEDGDNEGGDDGDGGVSNSRRQRKKRTPSKKAAPASSPSWNAQELDTREKVGQLLDIVEGLKDAEGRSLAEPWLDLVHLSKVKASSKRSETQTASLREIRSRCEQCKYNRLANAIADLDRLFTHVREKGELYGANAAADAAEGGRVVHSCFIDIQKGIHPGPIIAYANGSTNSVSGAPAAKRGKFTIVNHDDEEEDNN